MTRQDKDKDNKYDKDTIVEVFKKTYLQKKTTMTKTTNERQRQRQQKHWIFVKLLKKPYIQKERKR